MTLSELIERVECVMDSRHRWHATLSGEQANQDGLQEAVLCGGYLVLPWSSDLRKPTCPDCLRALHQKEAQGNE